MPEKIKLTFLGTGSAIPTKRRNHPSIFLQYKEENILIDCGEGTQRQLRIAGINPCKITRILISHWHGDHVLGLPGLLQTLMLNGYNKTLKIYGPAGTKKFMDIYLKLFTYKEKISIEVHEIKGKFVDESEFFIEAAEMEHGIPSLAYSFVVKEKIRLDKLKLKKLKIPNSPLISELQKGKTITISGKKINGKKLIYKESEKKITFVMDTKKNRSAVSLSKNSDILICESTFNESGTKLAKDYLHLTAKQAAEIAKESNSKKLILFHLSQRYENNPKIILEEAKENFKNTTIAEDFDKFKV